MDELGVDATLTHTARDQLRVLAAEVDDEHRAFLGLGLLGWERNNLSHSVSLQAMPGRCSPKGH